MQASRPNIIVIVIDTLRADHLGWYGTGAGVSPFLDSLPARGTLFSRAYSTASWTSPAVASLFTSRYPTQIGIVGFSSVIDPGEQTLAEQLQQAGYATAGFSANVLVNSQLGYAQGFDRFGAGGNGWRLNLDHNAVIKPRAERLFAAGEKWMDETQRERPSAPLFLFFQVMEAHEPLQPPADVLRSVAIRRGADEARCTELESLARAEKTVPLAWTPRDRIDLVRDLYDAEIASLDAQMKTFFAALEQRGILQKSIVVITADHGEEFLDHGAVGHGHTLFEELIHVPLLVALPGQTEPRRVDDIVSLVDVAPTILAEVGLPTPAAFEGKSLEGRLGPSSLAGVLAAFARWAGTSDSALSEQTNFGDAWIRPKLHQRALVKGTEKLIERRDGKREAYDLARDPGEQQPDGLSDTVTSELAAIVTHLEEELAANRSTARTVTLDEQTRERMRALGYEPAKQ